MARIERALENRPQLTKYGDVRLDLRVKVPNVRMLELRVSSMRSDFHSGRDMLAVGGEVFAWCEGCVMIRSD